MLGTAFPAARLLLVEQPGPWGRAGLTESHLDADVARRLEELALAHGIRLLAIRRPGRTPAGVVRRWALVDCRAGDEAERWGTYEGDHELLDLALDATETTGAAEPTDPTEPTGARPATEPLYLVCTNSKRDTCCALRGRPVAAALEALRPGRVWECSHLGGHRFAANVLVLPHGLLYGRLLPFAAEEFVAAAEAGEVVGALLRGRIGLPPAAQAALAFAYEHLAVRKRSALDVVSASPVADGVATVRIRGPHGMVDITVRIESLHAEGLSCADPGPQNYLGYRPIAVHAVE
jgi:hypothetical protein